MGTNDSEPVRTRTEPEPRVQVRVQELNQKFSSGFSKICH
jgi:hypothetical protein